MVLISVVGVEEIYLKGDYLTKNLAWTPHLYLDHFVVLRWMSGFFKMSEHPKHISRVLAYNDHPMNCIPVMKIEPKFNIKRGLFHLAVSISVLEERGVKIQQPHTSVFLRCACSDYRDLYAKEVLLPLACINTWDSLGTINTYQMEILPRNCFAGIFDYLVFVLYYLITLIGTIYVIFSYICGAMNVTCTLKYWVPEKQPTSTYLRIMGWLQFWAAFWYIYIFCMQLTNSVLLKDIQRLSICICFNTAACLLLHHDTRSTCSTNQSIPPTLIEVQKGP